MQIDSLRRRLTGLSGRLQADGLSHCVITPGPDLHYFTGYEAVALERITALVVPATGDPVLVSPLLERPAALASPIGQLGLEVLTWGETDDPYALIARITGPAAQLAVDGRMWADKLLRLQQALPTGRCVSGTPVIAALRRRKDASEVAALAAAGAAIDSVHGAMGEWLRVGRTEAEVGADIADAILQSGHRRVDFVIVGSGPNSASPHHEVSNRVIQPGDAVVVDIGGTMPSGYCSDSTRTYCMGQPLADFARDYEVLQAAQAAATAAVRPGVQCQEIDRVGRRVLADAGLGEYFIHRIGHGIGLEVHEEPYMVEGNDLPLEAGIAFSIEPGFYRAGVAGARIEDIVVCGESGAEVLNLRPRELAVIG